MKLRTPLNTDRLQLREESMPESDDVYRMNTNPAVMEFIGNGQPMSMSREQFRERYSQGVAQQQVEDYGTLAVYEKSSNRYMGWCGIWYTAWVGGYELGYRYLPEFWGKGYGTEAALAVVKEGFSVFPLDVLLAVTAKANVRSQRVLEKVGFTLDGEIYEDGVGANVLKYSLRRSAGDRRPDLK